MISSQLYVPLTSVSRGGGAARRTDDGNYEGKNEPEAWLRCRRDSEDGVRGRWRACTSSDWKGLYSKLPSRLSGDLGSSLVGELTSLSIPDSKEALESSFRREEWLDENN